MPLQGKLMVGIRLCPAMAKNSSEGNIIWDILDEKKPIEYHCTGYRCHAGG
jgi:hypothetical protein